MNGFEMKRYCQLNEIADANGIVIFGGDEDLRIPLGELKQDFSIKQKMYNRSFSDLSVRNAAERFDACVAPLAPDTVLVHIGKQDLAMFEESHAEFDRQYRNLLAHIKESDNPCRIAVISLRNHENDPLIGEMNRHLKHIAASEQCEYGDIASQKVWNPKSTKDTVSMVYSVGFVRPLNQKRPLYDLVKMLFCCEG